MVCGEESQPHGQCEPTPKAIQSSTLPSNSSNGTDPFSTPGSASLMIIGLLGMTGNTVFIIFVLVNRQHRKTSNAFLIHHAFLDFLKAVSCINFSYAMVDGLSYIACDITAGGFIVVVTTYAFNHLGLVMNEAYQFADLTLMVQDSRNCCCVTFGIFITWFSSMILNLGVAFIPGNPVVYSDPAKVSILEDKKTEILPNCDFIYGITRNYVLQILWILLITMALVLSSIYLKKLLLDIKRSSYYRLTTLIRATVSIDPKARTASQRRRSQEREKHYIKQVERYTLRNFYLLSGIVGIFVIFWYPFLILTLVDPNRKVSKTLYILFAVLAWSHPAITPMLYCCFLWNPCCCPKVDLKQHHVEDAIKNRQEMERHSLSAADNYEKSYVPEDNFAFDHLSREEPSGYSRMNLQSPNRRGSAHSEQSKRVGFWNVEV